MPDNISKFNDSLTSAERSENARAAGIESGRARRARAKLIKLSKSPAIMALLQERLDEDTITSMADAIIRAAIRGNIAAVRFIFSLEQELSGDAPDLDEMIIVQDEIDNEGNAI